MCRYVLILLFLLVDTHCFAIRTLSGNRPKKTIITIQGDVNSGSNIAIRVTNNLFVALNKPLSNISSTEKYFTAVKSKNFHRFSWSDIPACRGFLFEQNESNFSKRKLDFPVLIMPGDSININVSSNSVQFSGVGSIRYRCLYSVDSIMKMRVINYPAVPSQLGLFFKQIDSVSLLCYRCLNRYKLLMSVRDYLLARSFILTVQEGKKYTALLLRGATGPDGNEEITKALNRYSNPFWNSEIKDDLMARPLVLHTADFMRFIVRQFKIDSCILQGKRYKNEDCIKYLSNLTYGNLREVLLVYFVDENLAHNKEGLPESVNIALQRRYFGNRLASRYFQDYVDKNSVGVLAYNFQLPDIDGKLVTLSGLKGKIVLIDTWYIGCGPCIRLQPTLDSIRSVFEDSNFVVVSVCLDYTGDQISDWRKAVESGKYTSGKNINLYAPGRNGIPPTIVNNYHIYGCPTLILIDREGRLTNAIDERVAAKIADRIRELM